MKKIVLVSILIILFVPLELKVYFTIFMSFLWLIYTIYYCNKLKKMKDDKILTSKYMINPPNNNYSPYIRYLYNRKIDYKIFVSAIIELLIKDSISLEIEENNQYYLIDNKKKDEKLKKSEIYIKKILFKDIGDIDHVCLNNMIKKCSRNSGYLYSEYKEWQNIFEYEVAYNKYFKSNKNLIDKSTAFLIISFILSLYNILFIRNILVGLFIFVVAAIICKYINDIKNMEDDIKHEYKCWLEFRNYIFKRDNNLDELDIFTLQNYSTYAYVLDSYYEFKKVLQKKLKKKECNFDKSEVLTIINNGVFDDIEFIVKESINKLNVKGAFFAINKGRR